MPNEFTVVGENIADDRDLLVMGADGKYYEYDPARERFAPVEPDEGWRLFPEAEETRYET